MRAFKNLFILQRAKSELFMRGDLSRTAKYFQIELRLATWSY